MARILVMLLIEDADETHVPVHIRDRSNTFEDLSERNFIKRLRVNKELRMYIVDQLKNKLESERLPPSIRVII